MCVCVCVVCVVCVWCVCVCVCGVCVCVVCVWCVCVCGVCGVCMCVWWVCGVCVCDVCVCVCVCVWCVCVCVCVRYITCELLIPEQYFLPCKISLLSLILPQTIDVISLSKKESLTMTHYILVRKKQPGLRCATQYTTIRGLQSFNTASNLNLACSYTGSAECDVA